MNSKQKVMLIHLAMIGGCIVYAGIGYVIGQQPMEGIEPLAQELVYAFLGIAAALTVATFVVPKMAVKDISTFGPYFNRQLITWALCEAVAVLGLIVYLMDADRPVENLAIFIGWALVLMAIHTPKDVPGP